MKRQRQKRATVWHPVRNVGFDPRGSNLVDRNHRKHSKSLGYMGQQSPEPPPPPPQSEFAVSRKK